MKKILLIIAVLLLAYTEGHAQAGVLGLFRANYFIADDGNDANSGKYPWAPIKTIDKLNTLTLQPGQIVAFKRGDTFAGTITVSNSGTQAKPIVYSSYGSGPKPIIKGTTEVTGWTLHSGNIYKATLATKTNQVFVDGVKMEISRNGDFEQNSFLQVTTKVNDSTFTCNALIGTDWTGANVIYRGAGWSLESLNIIACTSGTGRITMEDVPEYALQANYPFYICNHLSLLDGAGQWCWNDATNTLYLWLPDDGSPTGHTIEVSGLTDGIAGTNLANVTIKNLEIKGFGGEGIAFFDDNTNVTVTNNTFTDNYKSGINLSYYRQPNTVYYGTAVNCQISNNTITGSAKEAITMHGDSSDIVGNTIKNIGLTKNLGIDGLTASTSGALGIFTSQTNGSISNNKIDSIGYINILFNGAGNMIEKNVLTTGCKLISDGGAIYTYGVVTGTIIQKNIIFDMGEAAMAGVGSHGIYMDASTDGVAIDSNTVYNNTYGIGIFTSHTSNSSITNNLSYNNLTQYQAFKSNIYAALFTNNTISDNVFYSTSKSQETSYFQFPETSWNARMTLSGNGYYNATSSRNAFYYSSNKEYEYNKWAAFTGETEATGLDSFLLPYENITAISTNYYDNSTFNTAITGWGGSPVWKDTTLLDGGCGRWEANSLTRTVTTTAGKLMRLSFDVIAPAHTGTAIVYINSAIIGSYDFDATRHRFSYVFTSSGASTVLQISGGAAGVYRYFDNIELVEIDADVITDKSKIFVNDTNVAEVQDLGSDDWINLDGDAVTSLTLQPYTSQILIQPYKEIPKVAKFTIPTTTASTTSIPITEMYVTAVSDSFLITETATTPLATNPDWVGTIPTTYTTASPQGTIPIFAWAKDVAGNVSTSKTDTITTGIYEYDWAKVVQFLNFDETSGTTLDDSKGTNDGTIVGGTITTGLMGNGVSLDGVNDKITFAAYPAITSGGTWVLPFTYSVWVYPNATGNCKIMQDNQTGGASHHIGMSVVSGKFNAGVVKSGNSYPKVATDAFSTGQWYFLTITFDGSTTLKFYVNGVEQTTAGTRESAGTTPTTGYVLGSFTDNTGYANMIFDQPVIDNYAMTAAEVGYRYNGGAGRAR